MPCFFPLCLRSKCPCCCITTVPYNTSFFTDLFRISSLSASTRRHILVLVITAELKLQWSVLVGSHPECLWGHVWVQAPTISLSPQVHPQPTSLCELWHRRALEDYEKPACMHTASEGRLSLLVIQVGLVCLGRACHTSCSDRPGGTKSISQQRLDLFVILGSFLRWQHCDREHNGMQKIAVHVRGAGHGASRAGTCAGTCPDSQAGPRETGPGSGRQQGKQLFILGLYRKGNQQGKVQWHAQGCREREGQSTGRKQQSVVSSLQITNTLLPSWKRHFFPPPGSLAFHCMQHLSEMLI